MPMDRRSTRGRAAALAAALILLPGLATTGATAQEELRVLAEQAKKLGTEPGEDQAAAADPDVEDEAVSVAGAGGTIAVESGVHDDEIRRLLQNVLPRFRGVRRVEVEVDEGIVTLTGHVEDEVVRDRLRDVARRVEGVVLVVNQARTDAQVLSAWQQAEKQLGDFGRMVARKWLVFAMAIGAVVLAAVVARLFGRFADPILGLLVPNVLLRSVLASLIGGAIVLGGLYAALSLLGLAQAVLSVLGLAGVVALAVGFAFRDITENFIASVLLGLRRPFRAGDVVELAGHSGVVKALNTRATVLVTAEGHHVRIPNALVFKSVIVNRTASARVRATFDLLMAPGASVSEAQQAIVGALEADGGPTGDRPPACWIAGLEPAGVRLRAFFWINAKADPDRALSEARLRVKVALQRAGLPLARPQTGVEISAAGPLPLELARGAAAADGRPRADDPADGRPTAADSRAAAATADHGPPADDAPDRLLDAADDGVSDEGSNLLETTDAR